MIRRHPRSTLFPYTALLRSAVLEGEARPLDRVAAVSVQVPAAAATGVPDASLQALLQLGVVGLLRLRADLDRAGRSEEHTSELQSRQSLVCRLLLEKKITASFRIAVSGGYTHSGTSLRQRRNCLFQRLNGSSCLAGCGYSHSTNVLNHSDRSDYYGT